MRTTVELTEEQHQALIALAARRGIRGFSPLVREAVDVFLADRRVELLDAVRSLRGSITDEEADAMRQRIREAWKTWRPRS